MAGGLFGFSTSVSRLSRWLRETQDPVPRLCGALGLAKFDGNNELRCHTCMHACLSVCLYVCMCCYATV